MYQPIAPNFARFPTPTDTERPVLSLSCLRVPCVLVRLLLSCFFLLCFAGEQQCLEDRRVIFLGDSVSLQQGYSLVGMLGWHPYWIKSRNPIFSGIEVCLLC